MKFQATLYKSAYDITEVHFQDRAADLDYKYFINESWEFESSDDDFSAYTVVIDNLSLPSNRREFTIQGDGFLANFDLSSKASKISVIIAAKERAIGLAFIAVLKEKFPILPEPSEGKVSVRFWYLTPNGPTNSRRTIAVPDWPQITLNYGREIKRQLDHLITEFKPEHGGQIILWHGQPGTGKTYALRALCQAWKSWCTVDYILDPESLFGGSPSYLASLVLNDAGEFDEDEDELTFGANDSKWKLLILEDTGELITDDAKDRSGQGLSRLLNLADGFIGQGLKVLVLITTNETVDKLNAAVSRPGRAASIIHFGALTKEEAREWAIDHDLEDIPDKKMLLADLYAEASKSELRTEKIPEPIGFKPNA